MTSSTHHYQRGLRTVKSGGHNPLGPIAHNMEIIDECVEIAMCRNGIFHAEETVQDVLPGELHVYWVDAMGYMRDLNHSLDGWRRRQREDADDGN